MSYADIRDGLLALLRDTPGFEPYAVVYEDYEPLNAGHSAVLVVSYLGFSRAENAFQGEEWRDWKLKLEMFTPFTTIPESRATEDTNRQRVIDRLYSYPQLNGTANVHDAWIDSGQPDPTPHELGDGKWLRERFEVTVREDVSGPTEE